MPQVSIIVPCYNVEKYLAECIESLQAQTLKDIEIILVDDGSPDNSGKICDAYAAKDSRIRVLHKPNQGVSAARNDGLKMATGEYVIFVDSDDYVPAEAYEKMYAKAKETNVDIVLADMYQVKNGELKYAQFFKEPFVTSERKFLDQLIQADFYRTYCPDPPQSGPAFGYGGPTNKLVRRAMLEEKGIQFDVSVKGIFDDIIYTAYIFAEAESVAYIQEPVYYYRLLDTSITRTYKANMPEINAAIFAAWQKFLGQFGSDGRFAKPYYANVIRRFEDTLMRYLFSEKNPQSHREIMRELKALIASEPFRTSIQNVEGSKLSKRHKFLVYLARTRSPWLIWAGVSGRDAIKRLAR